MAVLAELAICLVVYVFSHVTTAACLVFLICTWRSGIIVFFSPFPSLFLGKKLFPCFGGAFSTGLLLLLSFHLMFRLFFLLQGG